MTLTTSSELEVKWVELHITKRGLRPKDVSSFPLRRSEVQHHDYRLISYMHPWGWSQ